MQPVKTKKNADKADRIYDLIIIGGGAAGLFAGASLSCKINGLLLEKGPSLGKKLLLSGSGKCNLTHDGSIKEFISHYGKAGSSIRRILYGFNNQSVMEFFQERGLPLTVREDGKVFPRSMRADDVRKVLLSACRDNGIQIETASAVTALSPGSSENDRPWTVLCGPRQYQARHVLAATGGCSFPKTGSDGSFFSVLSAMGIQVKTPKPALTPIFTEDYPYRNLAGSVLKRPLVSVRSPSGSLIAENHGEDLLFTHTCFSGPAILSLSRFAEPGGILAVSAVSQKDPALLGKRLLASVQGSKKQIVTVLEDALRDWEESAPPRRYLEALCRRASISPECKASQLAASQIRKLAGHLSADTHLITGSGDFQIAMVTSGGVSLEEINLDSMESRQYPGLFFAGEMLDVDGDTGGYNLQFAFSSAARAAADVLRRL